MKKRKKVRELNVLKFGSLTCEYCGKINLGTDPSKRDCATIDHFKPLSAGGGNDWENLKIACINCNHKKNIHVDLKFRYPSNIDDLISILAGIEIK